MSIDGIDGRGGKKWIVVCILVAAAISAAGWMRLRIDSSLVPLLPQHSQARQTVLFFRDSSFADKVVLWFRLTGSGTLSDLIAAADAAEKRLDPKLISQVVQAPRPADAVDQAVALLDRAGELLDEKDLADLAAATGPDALKKRMRECYMQLVQPQGSFVEQIIRRDPLGISSRILSRLFALTNGLGYRMEMKDGHFVNPDGRQLLLILQTSSSAASLSGSRAVAGNLEEICAAAPAGIDITAIGAQIHTAQNQEMMQRDIHIVGLTNAVAFLLLFLGVSRDWRVAAVFLLPVVTTALTIGLCALFYPDLSAIMVGLAFAMAGSAVDYGVFVYTAVRSGPAAENLRRIRRPLLISHLTTLGVFVAFLFSQIPAYRQLGYLTGISLILSLLAALFVLPRFLKPGGRIVGLNRGMSLRRWGRYMLPVTAVGAVLLIDAAFIAKKIQFDSDISRLDGVSPAVKQAEKDFQHNWGQSDTELALLVVTGNTRAQAENANDAVYHRILTSPRFSDHQFVSLASFWPSPAARQANLRRWRQFWSPQRTSQLRADLAAAGQPYGFSADAFEPFFQSLANAPPPQPPQLLQDLEGQFVARSDGQWQMLNYFPDTPSDTQAATDLVGDRPDVAVVSRGVLTRAFESYAVSESHVLITLSALFVIAALLLLTRSLVKSLIILLPVVCGFVAMFAVLQKMGLSISVITVVGSIIVLALTSDYGVFALYAWEGHETILGQAMASMHLCFFATVTGMVAMIFGQHPAVFQIGLSLTSGLLAGYLSAFVAIPAICFLKDRRGAEIT